MKSRLLWIQVAVMCIAAYSAAAYAQAGGDRLNAPTTDGSPTLQVTSDWLAQTWPDYAGQYPLQRISNVYIDNSCKLGFTSLLKNSDDIWKNEVYSLPLGAVSNISIAINEDHQPSIRIETGNHAVVEDLITTSSGWRNYNPSDKAASDDWENVVFVELTNWQTTASPGADLPQTREQMAPRIISALQHAVTLCAGSFTPPAQSPQPF